MARNGLYSLAALVVLSLFLMGISGAGIDSMPRSAGFGLLNGINTVLAAVITPVHSVVTGVLGQERQSAEMEELRAENARLHAELAQLRDITTRFQELQQLTKIQADRPADEYIEARVRARDASGTSSAVAIDRGANSGIRAGMVVVGPNGSLIGKVTRVGPAYAWVRLVNDPSLAVSAVVLPSRTTGTVSGSFGQTLTLGLVPQGANVNQGDTVVSAGIGGVFPPSIPIGKVSKVTGDRQALFKEIEVTPLTDLSHLDYVLVISNFVPEGLGRP